MKNREYGALRLLLLIAAAPLASACRRSNPPLHITAEPKSYSPVMSSTVGIALRAFGPDGAPARARWSASYGGFVSWGPPDHKVRPLGSTTLAEDTTVYWSYDPKDMGAPKPPVEIRASADGEGDGALRLGWDGDSARVLGER